MLYFIQLALLVCPICQVKHQVLLQKKNLELGLTDWTLQKKLPIAFFFPPMTNLYPTFQEFQQFILTRSAEVRQMIAPGEFIMWINMEGSRAYIYMATMLFLFMVSMTLCSTLIWLILSSLKAKIEVFSTTTMKLHRQLTILLAYQVSAWILCWIF
jgi:hypothetical protein